MKTHGRSDTGGRVPPSHDDYDDYEDVEVSAEDGLEVSDLQMDDYADEAPAPEAPRDLERGTRSNTRTQRATGNGPERSAAVNGPERSPAAPARPQSAIPRRRQRADVAQVAPAAPPPSAKPSTGNGKPWTGNGAAIASVATRPEPPAPRTSDLVSTEAEAPSETLQTRFFRFLVNYETLIYMGIFVLALFTRFWDIGNRGIHHDESLHAVYSRNLYIGPGYSHDPMMHGPLQFHVISFMYWLFGTSDATARFASAFCGIFVVMSPLFLRRQMGRWPAIIASFLLLVSPGVLYFSRMAREDSIFSAMEMLMLIGLWRFISMRKPADFFLFSAGLSLMFTIKETAYLSVAILGIMFALLFALQAGWAIFGAFMAYGVAMGGMLMVINGQIKSGLLPKLPDIPAQNPDYGIITNFATNLLGHPLVQWSVIITAVFVAALIFLLWSQKRRLAQYDAYDYDMAVEEPRTARPTRPARGAQGAARTPQAALPTRRSRVPAESTMVATAEADGLQDVVTVRDGISASPELSPNAPRYQYDSDEASEIWSPTRLDPKPGTLLAHYQPGSMPHLIGSLFARPSVLLIGFLIAATIFTVFYTVFFTDVPRGLASGLFASLGYWMAQQGVERGGQPWYYYLLLIPLYQPIAVFFSLVATAFFSVKGIRGILRKRADRRYSETYEPGMGAFNTDRPVPLAKFSAFLPFFIIWWLAGAVFIYSWAGEKMPWLMVHMTRPAIFLSALFLGALVASVIARRNQRIAWEREYYAEADVVEDSRQAAVAARPSRTRGPAARTQQPVRRAAPLLRGQDPPWVSWNRSGSKFPAISFLMLFTVLALAWGLKMNGLARANNTAGWGITWVYPALMVILIVAYAVWLGPGRVMRYAGLGIFSIFFLYEFRSATNLAYQHPDVPTEMAVYVQTSPDVTRTVREIQDYSYYSTGGLGLKVVYDSFASWPFEWYFRDYKGKVFIGGGDPPVSPDNPIMVLEYAKSNPTMLDSKVQTAQASLDQLNAQIAQLQSQPQSAERDNQISNAQASLVSAQTTYNNWRSLRNDYVIQRYAMRWWFPEDWYKRQFIQNLDVKNTPFLQQVGAFMGTTIGSVTQPDMTATLWKYLIFRETPMPLGSEDMNVFVRRDIAQTFHYLQYKPPSTTDEPPMTTRFNAEP